MLAWLSAAGRIGAGEPVAERSAVARSEREGRPCRVQPPLVCRTNPRPALRSVVVHFWPLCVLLLPFLALGMNELPVDPCLLGFQIAGDLGGLTFYINKRGKLVAFPRVKPCKPPSELQLIQRHRFALAQHSWSELTTSQKEAYELATNRLSICMTGANLWIHFCLSGKKAVWDTVQQQSGIVLAPPLPC